MAKKYRPEISTAAQKKNHAALMIDLANEGEITEIAELARRHGVSTETAAGLKKQLDRQLLPVKQRIQEYSVPKMIDALHQVQVDIINSIDEEALAKASFSQKAIGFGIFSDKSQLLQGLPTQIMTVEDRMALPEILQHLRYETERRDMTINVTPTEGEDAEKDSVKISLAGSKRRPKYQPRVKKNGPQS